MYSPKKNSIDEGMRTHDEEDPWNEVEKGYLKRSKQSSAYSLFQDIKEEETPSLEWSSENETVIVEWCDIAQCYKWMHSKSHDYYSSLHAWFTIPAIILSTIIGTASFAQNSLPNSVQSYYPMIIGTVNISIGIFTTIQQYLKIAEKNESHRISAISWDKYYRNLRIELSKTPEERMEAGHFIKIGRQDYDRLIEMSPTIPPHIVILFNKKFSGKDGLKKPDICDSIVSTNELRHYSIHSSIDGHSEYSVRSKTRENPSPPRSPTYKMNGSISNTIPFEKNDRLEQPLTAVLARQNRGFRPPSPLKPRSIHTSSSRSSSPINSQAGKENRKQMDEVIQKLKQMSDQYQTLQGQIKPVSPSALTKSNLLSKTRNQN